MIFRLLGIIICLSGFIGCAAHQSLPSVLTNSFEPELLIQREVSIAPMRSDHTLLWQVEVEIDGIKGWFAIDTGSPNTILSSEFANKMIRAENLTRKNQPRASRKFTHITYLKAGGVLFLDFFAPISDLSHINATRHLPIDGILGNNILDKAVFTFDWRKKLLELNAGISLRPSDAIPVTISNHQIRLNAEVNHHTLGLALDTGSFCSCLTSNEVSRLNISAANISRVEAPQIDITQHQILSQTKLTLENLKIGQISRSNFPMLVWKENVLGMDWLEPWVLTIDMRNNWMSFKSSKEDH